MSLKAPLHPVDQHVGARIRLRRKLLRISQVKLAQGLGLTFQQVQKYKRGTNRVSASMLYNLAGLLRTRPAWFFEGLPPTETGIPAEPEELEAARAVQAMLATPDGLALAELLAGLRCDRRQQVLTMMETLVEPAEDRAAA
ncbi:transcriptional regulator [Caulobacter zeae]|uniref:Transcriptional regulator n=1 Tax=Caulobacter zeae TaxID=2055137 RepID=A0A2N5DRG3_9CAUL|nr:helix-turn-helix transcriptional regulator [Caulobacter zeae]PLR28650.1 transcriptional regulator [Caulobacter zeae]